MAEQTKYSEVLLGGKSNYGLEVQFDLTDGTLGISQRDDRVLLSPAQVKALKAFLRDDA